MIISPGGYEHYAPHAVVTSVTGLFMWLAKRVGRSIKDEWKDTKDKLNAIATTTQIQAENHLTTIQHNTARSNDLLEKVVEGQAEMNGFLKGAFRG
jgi:hypothetical protein